MWRQDGPKATTNALFLAYVNQHVSSFFLGTERVCMRIVFPRKRLVCIYYFLLSFERGSHRDGCNLQNVFAGHNIIPNGYDIGR